jgi:hypothetical protein
VKKSIRKLALRSETVRALRSLDLDEATPVRGGDGNAVQRAESTGTCPGPAAITFSMQACG